MPRVARLLLSPAVLVALCGPLSAGCAHVALTSSPPGATVTVAGVRRGVTPLDLPVPVVGGRRVRVELNGYRPLDVRLGVVPPRALELRLVEEHGAAGSWDPEDAP